MELSKQKELNDKLETDLLALDKRSAPSSGASGNSDDPLVGLDLDIGIEKAKPESSTVQSSPIPFTSVADTSILPIVTSQRDRFRQRNAELEEVCSLFPVHITLYRASHSCSSTGTSQTIPCHF